MSHKTANNALMHPFSVLRRIGFAQNNRRFTVLGQFIKAQQGTRIWQTLPAPLLGLAVCVLTPRQGRTGV